MPDWILKAFIAVVCLTPSFVIMQYIEKRMGLRSEAVLVWWFAGIVLGVAIWLQYQGDIQSLRFGTPAALLLLIGVTIGTVAHIALFQSVMASPNPGASLAVVNTNAITVYLFALLCAKVAPRLFTHISFSWPHLIGALFIVIGGAFIVLKR